MTLQEETYEPVRVHVASVDAGIGHLGAARKRKVYRSTYETFLLTANDPVQCILAKSDKREIAYINAFDNDITLGSSFGQIQADSAVADLTVAGVQLNGALISKANGSAFPVIDSGAVFAACATAKPARVTVHAVYCDD